MASKLPSPRITDLVTTVDSEVFQSSLGPMVWGKVEIVIALTTLSLASQSKYLFLPMKPKVTNRGEVKHFDARAS